MALTRKDAVQFVHTDVDGNLYGVFIGLDGIGRARPYPQVTSVPVHPDITYDLTEVPITVDAPYIGVWLEIPFNVKKVCPLYNGGKTIEQILNPI